MPRRFKFSVTRDEVFVCLVVVFLVFQFLSLLSPWIFPPLFLVIKTDGRGALQGFLCALVLMLEHGSVFAGRGPTQGVLWIAKEFASSLDEDRTHRLHCILLTVKGMHQDERYGCHLKYRGS